MNRNTDRLRLVPIRPYARRARCRLAALVAGLVACALAPAASAMPLISELFYDAVGSDDGYVFVELSGEPGASLDGLVLVGINGSNGAAGPTLPLTGVFGDDGLFVVADRTSDGLTFVPGADLLLNFDFQNGPDSVVLEDELGVLDSVGYGDFAAGDVFAGEGSPAPDPAAGASIARLFADLDLDDNALDFVVEPVPTPGEAFFQPVPEPGTGALAGLGLFALGRLRRSPRARVAASLERRGLRERMGG